MVFRRLLGSWLQNTARQKLREKVVAAAREEIAAAARRSETEEAADREQPCDVGVVCALGIEAGGLHDLLDKLVVTRGYGFVARQGTFKGRQVVVIQSGPGGRAATRATEALLAGHHPRWVISAGFAGGLDPKLKRRDLLMADGLVDESGKRLAVDLKVDPEALAQTPGVHVGRLLSVDRIVRSPDEKRALGETHQAVAVDMETFAVAEVCREARARFLAIRIVSDGVDEELPPDLRRLMKQQTHLAKLGAVFGTVWRRPSSVKDMLGLKENALVASDRLAKFLASTIEQLAPLPPACT